MIGTLEEAQAIYDAVGSPISDFRMPPPGWREIGAGGTRHCYLSPSGVVYKVCYDYDDELTYNDREQLNFERIRKSGKLPDGWRVPKSHLHTWRDSISRYNSRLVKVDVPARITVIAMEYIPGRRLGSLCDNTGDEWWDMEQAFRAVGLCDTGGANAIRKNDGTRYIIDAAEDNVLIGV